MYRHIIINKRLIKSIQLEKIISSIKIRLKIRRIHSNCLVIICDSLIKLAQCIKNEAPGIISLIICWMQNDCLTIVCNRFIHAMHFFEQFTPIIVSYGHSFRILANSMIPKRKSIFPDAFLSNG